MLGDVLLATHMNGEPLPAEHGGPLRVIVPGYIGARSVKWVSRIVASPQQSYSTWQRGVAYRSFNSTETKHGFDGVEPVSAFGVMELPVQSAITSPLAGTMLPVRPSAAKCASEAWPSAERGLAVSGFAWSGGGRNITRVDVSADGGQVTVARTMRCENIVRHHYSRFWHSGSLIPCGLSQLS
eukprot:SAG31_NODE_4239_length_3431_cov_2.742197_3_plen_183_part_00